MPLHYPTTSLLTLILKMVVFYAAHSGPRRWQPRREHGHSSGSWDARTTSQGHFLSGWDLTPPFTSTEGLELWVQTHESYTVDLSFGSSNPKADGFWRSPMQADMDEFFTKMSIALEAFRELNFKHWKENRLMLVAGTVGHNHHNQYLTCWVVGIRVA